MANGALKASILVVLVARSVADPSAAGSSAAGPAIPRLDTASSHIYLDKLRPFGVPKAETDGCSRKVLIPVQGAAMSVMLGVLTEIPAVQEALSFLVGHPVPCASQLAQKLSGVFHRSTPIRESETFASAEQITLAEQIRRRPTSARGVAAMIGLFVALMGFANSRQRRSSDDVSDLNMPLSARSSRKKKSVTLISPSVSPRKHQQEDDGADLAGEQGRQGFVKANVAKIDGKADTSDDSDRDADVEAVRAAYFKINTPGTSRAASRAASKASSWWASRDDEDELLDAEDKDATFFKINTPGTSRAPSKSAAGTASMSTRWWSSE
eukprot:gb/GFBE01050357.1/.p1 GENE.gb/GFBE01050357.1/~~gb/GFBE01050357.1/.p1  ORF type:complete len:325 (+),score=72.95 gb/GFBE01050357.1/:1-975(+)